jgi:hypothetical protein
MRRIVLFTKNMPGMVAFYRDVLDLKLGISGIGGISGKWASGASTTGHAAASGGVARGGFWSILSIPAAGMPSTATFFPVILTCAGLRGPA